MSQVRKQGAKLLLFSGLCLTIPAVGVCQSSATQSSDTAQAAPDNTKQNKAAQPTADQQNNNATDLDLAKNVRHVLMQDKSLSTYAHNVKVTAQDGKVTLKGPVKSDDEKQAITAKATEVAGQGNVVDELTVAPPK
jgi:osmotically-inducible protein OsmY